jgi:hypothetical protein
LIEYGAEVLQGVVLCLKQIRSSRRRQTPCPR